MTKHAVLLIILDGFGVNPSRAHNGWALANTPHLDHYFASNPHTLLQASGSAVGLPDGQFGNSEVGHLTLGSGRILEQDLLRINKAIHHNKLADRPVWKSLVDRNERIHLVGLVSDGGVHSHIHHLLSFLTLLVNAGITPVIHVITDGRDSPPQSAIKYVSTLERRLKELGCGEIATVCGRYFAMDRAKHWTRTENAWSAMVLGNGLHAKTALSAIESAYARGESDEFIQPTVVCSDAPIIAKHEVVFFFNFRSDRTKQLAAAVGLNKFSKFDRNTSERPVVCLTEYQSDFTFPAIFPNQQPKNVLADLISKAGLRQFHCAEQEKYPHVTNFFNGGWEKPFHGEDRVIVHSKNVATYDLAPEMSAAEVADQTIKAIESNQYDFIVVNLANADMVGHTAVRRAIIQAVETLDLQSHRVIQAALKHEFRILLTADHGNCDEMVDPLTGEAHTQHTPYPVPLLLMGEPGAKLGTDCGLSDVAPTVLNLLGLTQPSEMTGHTIILDPHDTF